MLIANRFCAGCYSTLVLNTRVILIGPLISWIFFFLRFDQPVREQLVCVCVCVCTRMYTVSLIDNISVRDDEIAVLWDVAPCIWADTSCTDGC
jgi:hypothetical protein